MKIRVTTYNWRELRFANMSSNDSRKVFICENECVEWFVLPFDLTDSIFLSILAFLAYNMPFTYENSWVCVCLLFRIFFFSALRFRSTHTLYFIGKMWTVLDVDAREWLHQKHRAKKKLQPFIQSKYISRTHIAVPYTSSTNRSKSNNTMKMSIYRHDISRDKNTSHKCWSNRLLEGMSIKFLFDLRTPCNTSAHILYILMRVLYVSTKKVRFARLYFLLSFILCFVKIFTISIDIYGRITVCEFCEQKPFDLLFIRRCSRFIDSHQ